MGWWGRFSVLTGAAAALLLTGCGSGTEEPKLDTGPSAYSIAMSCADVWVDGHTLPTEYVGCTEGGSVVSAATIDCGQYQLTTYLDHFWGFLGGNIHQVESYLTWDPGYRKAYKSCLGPRYTVVVPQ